MDRYVYLAGPIGNLYENQAKGWRQDMIDRLAVHGIIGVSPLRCEPAIGGKYDSPEMRKDPKFGSAKAINAKNWFDTARADIVLAYMPLDQNRQRISVGTIYELAWASAHRKPTLLVSDDEALKNHPLVLENTSWILDNLTDAVEVIAGVLGVYTLPAPEVG